MVKSAAEFGKVAVLMGGTAAEREISLVSGNAVLEALQAQGVDAYGIDIKDDPINQIQQVACDRVFNVLHGRGGEDGQIQGMLECMKLPYTGSGVMGSSISMDKYRTKLVWQGLGLPTPGFVLMRTESDIAVAAELGFPLMIKPAHEGSSIGMAYVESIDSLKTAWQNASQYDDYVLAEKWVTGKEYTASILGQTALPLIRLETENQFYDFEAKYELDTTQYLVPCGMDAQMETELQQLALTAFNAVGSSGWGRVDLMVDDNNQPWLIEVNTVPGMTSHSLVPMAAGAVGISFEQLVWKILEQTVVSA